MIDDVSPVGTAATEAVTSAEFTGKFLVLLDPEDASAGVAALNDGAGIASVESAASAAEVADVMAGGGNVMLQDIGVAVVSADPEQTTSLLQVASSSPRLLAVERERIVTVLPVEAEFLRGYRAGVDALVDSLVNSGGTSAAEALAVSWDESRVTWGLQATRVSESCGTGAGVRVAVLDTGVDLTHRDLVGRDITTASFVPGEEVQDGHGHGTHCIGTSCGSKAPAVAPRYGIASAASIYAGKVLSNAGSGADSGILAGINWAVANQCRIVSMSLGAPTRVGAAYSRVFESVAMRARARGTIIVAAAGNDSQRPGSVQPVSHPANCPSILAVAALDAQLAVAPFSNAGLNPDGGQVDIAGPGVGVRSSWPEPTGYRTVSGTSMATPHVAGILALFAEAAPQAGAADLIAALLAAAKRLELSSADVGSGLVQAP